MIVCYIDGNPAYPSTSSSIKVTLENAAIKERESRTQELTFNLDIADNRKVFGAVNRIDARKSSTTFATCRLYADNLLVIEGAGTITSYSDTEVKMQIKTATAASQYPESFSSLYIDRVVGGGGVDGNDVSSAEQLLDESDGIYLVTSDLFLPTADSPLIPVYDEANARWLNEIVLVYPDTYYNKTPSCAFDIRNYAPQPPLKDVVARIVNALGYKEAGGTSSLYMSPIAFFSQHPWSKLHVVNANCSYRLRNMIPHWTAEKFFTELSNLFNLRFAFDEKAKTVAVYQSASTDNAEECHYDCLDEFSSDYDEDGESLLASSNLAYNVGGSSMWDNESLSQDTMAQFEIVDYPSAIYLFSDFDHGMSEKEKLTRLFRTPKQMYYARHSTDGDGNKASGIELAAVPLANLVRQPESGDTLDINIVPVCLASQGYKIATQLKMNGNARSYDTAADYAFPTTAESKATSAGDYVTVEDVVDGTDSDKTDEQERMELFFVDGSVAVNNDYKSYDITHVTTYLAKCFTYNGSNPDYDNNFTLALCDTSTYYSVGKLHSQASKVESHETVVIKFESSDLPAPRKVFVFRNKRFLCDKIELEITSEGISKIKTGYFFEMQ